MNGRHVLGEEREEGIERKLGKGRERTVEGERDSREEKQDGGMER